jgi:hypothetical protein
MDDRAPADPALDPSDPADDPEEGEYYGELYGSDSRFEWLWWAITWLTIPLFAAYLVYRVVT